MINLLFTSIDFNSRRHCISLAVVHFGERNKPGRFTKKEFVVCYCWQISGWYITISCFSTAQKWTTLLLHKCPNINFNTAFVPLMMRIKTLSWRSSDGHPSANKTNICSNFCFGVCHVVSRMSRLFWRRLLFSGSKNLFWKFLFSPMWGAVA